MTAPRVLVIVPARGGSKGVPRKNVRLLHGTPLIGHVLRTLTRSRYTPSVWVTTDDEEIAAVAGRYGASVVRRPGDLAADHVTLDPVVHHAVTSVEAAAGGPWDVVATVQPTSPLLSVERFDSAVSAIIDDGYDTALTVVRDVHLRWRGSIDRPEPAFAARLNRQQLPLEFRETGSVLATRRAHVTPAGRFGPRVRLIELPAAEAVDIDSNADWWLADNILDRRRLAFRVDGGDVIGLGHVHRALTLTSRLFNHDIRFYMDPALPDGIRLAQLNGMHVVPTDGPGFRAAVAGWRPDVILLDVLDTDEGFVGSLRPLCDVIATFEDLGSGADAADLVFNEMYADPRADGIRRFSGPEVACLREEFYSVQPRPVRDSVREILVTFGGTDPNNLTLKALRALNLLPGPFHVNVVLGLGYRNAPSLTDTISASPHDVQVHQNVRSISTLMTEADLALTSGGRTVFELIACQTPVLALTQNARESLHTCTDERYGVTGPGLGASLPETAIAGAIRDLLPRERREEARRRMAAVDLWTGPDRIITSILALLRSRRLRDGAGRRPGDESGR